MELQVHIRPLLVCRSVSASFEQSVDLKGIQVWRYVLLPETLAAPSDNPDNHCFCRDRRVTNNCTLAGALDLSSCQNGSLRVRLGCPEQRPAAADAGLCCRQTRLHLAAPLPPWQPRPAAERPGPESRPGASQDLPGRGAGELRLSPTRFYAKLATQSDPAAAASPPDHRLHVGLR